MANRSTTAHVRDRNRHITLAQHETDAPVLPINQIRELRDLHPERVDWVFEETSAESAFRRSELRRINLFTFIERAGAQIFGFCIACIALYAAYKLAMADHDAVAGVIGGTTVVGLVTAFVIGNKKAK